MSDAPRQPPPKKEVALALLEESSMFIHLDPRRPGVIVPKGFMGQPQLVLQVGLNMAIPIRDLKLDESGISCTLSFNRSPFWCNIPWTAVYALVGEDGRGGVWADDVPPEIQNQRSTPPKSAGKKPRAKLTAVPDGGPSEGPPNPPGHDGGNPSRQGGDAQATETKKPSSPPSAAPRPLRAVAKVEEAGKDDGILEDEPARAPRETPASAPSAPQASAAAPEVADDASPTPPGPGPGGKKPKREIPPWLRVIK